MIGCAPSAVLYRYPDAKSEMTDELLFGTVCELLDTVDDYCRVETDYGYRGYLRRCDLSAGGQQPSRIVSVPFADLLFTPEYRRAPRMVLPMGSVVDAAYSKTEPRFAFGYMPDKTVCCIRKECLSPLPAPADERTTRGAVVRTAQSFLGTQYRWGGKTHAGVDCSGLAFMCYRMSGLTLYRDAVMEKSAILREIEYGQAQPGDLLFFRGHVAVDAGGGRFIHASASAGRVEYGSIEPDDELFSPDLRENLLHTGTVF